MAVSLVLVYYGGKYGWKAKNSTPPPELGELRTRGGEMTDQDGGARWDRLPCQGTCTGAHPGTGAKDEQKAEDKEPALRRCSTRPD